MSNYTEIFLNSRFLSSYDRGRDEVTIFWESKMDDFDFGYFLFFYLKERWPCPLTMLLVVAMREWCSMFTLIITLTNRLLDVLLKKIQGGTFDRGPLYI